MRSENTTSVFHTLKLTENTFSVARTRVHILRSPLEWTVQIVVARSHCSGSAWVNGIYFVVLVWVPSATSTTTEAGGQRTMLSLARKLYLCVLNIHTIHAHINIYIFT